MRSGSGGAWHGPFSVSHDHAAREQGPTQTRSEHGTGDSRAYDALGGMHANKPDHKFVLISREGTILWAADYPSMWVPGDTVLKQVRTLVSPPR